MRKKDAETVRFQLDPANLLPLNEAQKAELDALKAMPDSSIDYSDAPALADDFGRSAQRGRFARRKGKAGVTELLAIADRAAAHGKRPYADHAELLYDDNGLPK